MNLINIHPPPPPPLQAEFGKQEQSVECNFLTLVKRERDMEAVTQETPKQSLMEASN